MLFLPHRISGSKTPLSEHLTVSILIDRTLLVEAEKNVLLLLSAEETTALHIYLQHHEKKFTGGKDGQP